MKHSNIQISNNQNIQTMQNKDNTIKFQSKQIIATQSNKKKISKNKSILRQSLTNNPQNEQLKMLVKEFLKQHNVKQLRQKFKSTKDNQRNLRTSMQRTYQSKVINKIRLNDTNEIIQDKDKELAMKQIRRRRNHSYNNIKDPNQIDSHHLNCQKCSHCTCKKHHCQVKIQIKDPISRFETNNLITQRQVKRQFIQNSHRSEMQATFYADKLKNLPKYHQKAQNLNGSSSYQTEFQTMSGQSQKVENMKYLKKSNVKFGPKEIKNFQSSYSKEYNLDKSIQGPKPFIVKAPENLNTFGLKYHSIDSKYHQDYQPKSSGRRSSLRPRDLLKDLDVYLIKDSKYKQQFSLPSGRQKSFRNKQSNKTEKIPVLHHLSSSFIPLDGLNMDATAFESAYTKDYKSSKKDLFEYACPYGRLSSNGAASKLY